MRAAILAALFATQVAATPVLYARQSAGSPVTVSIDPSYQFPEFQGWGTSLAWLGVKTGGYSDEVRTKLVDLLFGPTGLNLNIARYNVGGGNAPTVKDYLRPGGAVPGWWNADKAYGPNDKDWWNPANESHWNFDADPNQRWWIDQIKDKVTIWEAFSNSPPWFHTVSGYVSGGFSATAEQIRESKIDEFATYMVKVVDHLEVTHGIKFATIEPVNEPNTNYWGTNLGSDGNPTGGRQEGCHVGPGLMSKLFVALKNVIATANTKALVSAPDETNPTTFMTDFYGFTTDGINAVSQLNVHTYGTSGRTSARDVAKSAQKPLWMSEIEGSWGKTFTGMDSGLGMAQQIVNDIRELEPSAWVLWQPIEDYYNMIAEGNLQWGEIHVPFNCSSTDGLDACPVKTNTKFHTIRQFTHYIRPGDRIVKVGDTNSLAAIKHDGSGAVVVHVNNQNATREVSLDCSKFGTIDGDATVTPITTSDVGALIRGSPVPVVNNIAKIKVPVYSVTTFLISGVSGVSDSAPAIQEGKYYTIKGVQSGKMLQVSTSGTSLVINTGNGKNNQLWSLRSLDSKYSNRNRYAIVNADTKTRLAVTTSGSIVMQTDTSPVPDAAQWTLSTTGDGTYTLVSIGVRAVMDVGGQATADNSPVGTYQPNTGTNQRWTFTVGTPAGIPTVSLTVQVDPSYQHPEFQGWGSSLAWMGVVTGTYPDEVRTKLVDLIFGEDGLRLNIARYNVGGGNAPSVRDYMRPGGAVPGWWRAPQVYGPNDKEWWDINNPDHWNFDADPNQRWWIDQIKGRITRWESFSNSPPWFQTVSGYVSGGFDATTEQIREEKIADFVAYMVKVTEQLERAHGIKFSTIEPINEPNTNYWSTKLGADGKPTGGRQEGCHVGPTMQGKVFVALKRALANSTLSAVVSAPDETNPSTFLTDWYGYSADAIEAVSQLNVHTYGTGSRMPARDIAKAALKPLWMSEVEGSWGNDFTSMNSGLGMAQLIVDDLRELEPHAWVLWQPIEDLYNMIAEGNLQWGEVHVPFNCTASTPLAGCQIKTNTKFNTIRQFTHFIRPGDRVVKNSDGSSTAAIKGDGTGAVVVHVNNQNANQLITLDLTGFAQIASNAQVTPYTTSVDGALVKGSAVSVVNGKATLTVVPFSVTTFVVSGVSGVNEGTALVKPGGYYTIKGVQSGKFLQPSTDGKSLVIFSGNGGSSQTWALRGLDTPYSNRNRYVIVNEATKSRLAVNPANGAIMLESDATPATASAQWILSTNGLGTYTLVSVGARAVMDVGSQSTSDNAGVGTWQPNQGSNQQWTLSLVKVVPPVTTTITTSTTTTTTTTTTTATTTTTTSSATTAGDIASTTTSTAETSVPPPSPIVETTTDSSLPITSSSETTTPPATQTSTDNGGATSPAASSPVETSSPSDTSASASEITSSSSSTAATPPPVGETSTNAGGYSTTAVETSAQVETSTDTGVSSTTAVEPSSPIVETSTNAGGYTTTAVETSAQVETSTDPVVSSTTAVEPSSPIVETSTDAGGHTSVPGVTSSSTPIGSSTESVLPISTTTSTALISTSLVVAETSSASPAQSSTYVSATISGAVETSSPVISTPPVSTPAASSTVTADSTTVSPVPTVSTATISAATSDAVSPVATTSSAVSTAASTSTPCTTAVSTTTPCTTTTPVTTPTVATSVPTAPSGTVAGSVTTPCSTTPSTSPTPSTFTTTPLKCRPRPSGYKPKP